MKLNAIVIKSLNNVIGIDNGLPWSFKEDMNCFKACTMGSTVIMGSKTWDSLYVRPLPGRENIIISRTMPKKPADGAIVLRSYSDVLLYLEVTKPENIWVIGGGSIYRMFDPVIEEWYVTEVSEILDQGLQLPPMDKQVWKCNFARHAETFNGTFKRYVRR